MEIETERPTRSWRNRATVAAVSILASTLLVFAGTPAQADDNVNQYGNLKCGVPAGPLTGTESTARGSNVTHRLYLNTGISLWGNAGTSSFYTTWGWTFWHGATSTRLSVAAFGSKADVVNNSLKRYCRWI